MAHIVASNNPRTLNRDHAGMITFTGKDIDPCRLRIGTDICIQDIAHGLSNECRWSGQGPFYSVAQHSLILADHVPKEMGLEGVMFALLHDAEEGLGFRDIARRLKEDFADYCLYANEARRRIFSFFGLVGPMPEEIHETDQRLQASELRLLMDWTPGVGWPEPLEIDEIVCLPPRTAEHLFLRAFRQVKDERDKQNEDAEEARL